MNTRLILLIAVAVLLGSVYFWPQAEKIPPHDAPKTQIQAPAAAPEAEASVNPLGTAAADGFADVFTRPLFTRSRRGPLPAAGSDGDPGSLAPTSDTPDFNLVGVIRAPAPGGVLLIAAAGGSAEFLATGDSRDGWTLTQVSDKSAVFTNDAGTKATLGLPLPDNMFDGTLHQGDGNAQSSGAPEDQGSDGTDPPDPGADDPADDPAVNAPEPDGASSDIIDIMPKTNAPQ